MQIAHRFQFPLLTTPRPLHMADEYTEKELAEFKEVFDHYDKDGDGSITTNELGPVMRTLGRNPTEAQLQEIVNEMDMNGDYLVTFDMFLGQLSQIRTVFLMEADIKKAFAVFDKVCFLLCQHPFVIGLTLSLMMMH